MGSKYLVQEPTDTGNTGPVLADNQSRELNNEYCLVFGRLLASVSSWLGHMWPNRHLTLSKGYHMYGVDIRMGDISRKLQHALIY